jgi:hypothetical protein
VEPVGQYEYVAQSGICPSTRNLTSSEVETRMKRREFIVAAVAGGTALCGCIGNKESALMPSSSDSPGTKTTPSSPTETDSLVVAGDGEYPHPIRVDNALARTVTLTLRVEHDGEQVYVGKHTVDSQTNTVVAGITKPSLQENSQSLTVVASETSGDTTSVTFPVSESLWHIRIYFGADGALNSTYATR